MSFLPQLPDLLAKMAQPSAPATPQNQISPLDLLTQAANLPDAPRRGPAFRTPDLLAVLGTALAGKQGGDFLGGYLQGKQIRANDDTRRDQVAVDRQRQLLGLQAQDLTRQQSLANERALQDQKLRYDADQGERDRLSRERVAETNVGGRSDVAQINAGARTAAAKYAYEGKSLDNDTKRFLAGQVSQDKNLSAALTLLPKLPEAARPKFLAGLRDQFDVLKDLDDDAIKAVGQSTATEAAKRAQIEQFKAQTGYLGARTKNLEALTGPQRDLLLKRAAKVDQDIDVETAKIGLLEAQAAGVRKKTSLYEPEFRAKVARYGAQIAKSAGSSDLKEIGRQKTAYTGLKTIATQQIARIKADYKGAPSEILYPEAYIAYQQAVADQAEAEDALKKLNRQVLSVNPVTSAPSQPYGGTRPGTSNVQGGPLAISGVPVQGGIGQSRSLGNGVTIRRIK